MHFSRMILDDPAVPGGQDTMRTTYGHHQKIWEFYAGDPESERDFLYRFDLGANSPRFYAVSTRPPQNRLPGWRIETKPYAPAVEQGARLRFSLRANPTKRIAEKGQRSDGARHDVVMVRKRLMQEAGEAVEMSQIVQEEGFAWLKKQGERHGFVILPHEVRADGYQSHRFRKSRGGREVSITGIDYEGVLTVANPSLFEKALLRGIGPAKGFGFGLMMVRRA